jgi:hypothetical protein
MPSTNSKTKKTKRPNAFTSAGLRRHESPWLRPIDICVAQNVCKVVEWRNRTLIAGHPKPNALGLYNAKKVARFYACLTREQVRAARLGKRGSADGASASSRAVKLVSGRDTATGTATPRRVVSEAVSNAAHEITGESGKAAKRPDKADSGDCEQASGRA